MTDHVEIQLHNKLSELSRLHQTLTEFAARHGLSDNVLYNLKLALEEIFTNVVSHGYTDSREHEIRVRLSIESEELRVDVEDDGKPFNPLDAPKADTTQRLEDRAVGGLGIDLVRKLTNGLEYHRHEGKNLLVIKMRLR